VDLWSVVVFVLMGVHAMWNAPYFGRQAIEANIIDCINRFDLSGNSKDSKKAIRLMDVRSKSGLRPRWMGHANLGEKSLKERRDSADEQAKSKKA
jgi:hypothetical protein